MKKVLFAVLCLSLAWSGCKKNEPTPAESTENGKASEDNQGVQNHADAAITDANNLVSANGTLSGRLSEAAQNAVDTNICGAAKDYSQIGQGILTVSYDGVTVCNNRKRGGTIKITLLNYATGARWIQANAKLKVDFINYKVTRASDGKSIKLTTGMIGTVRTPDKVRHKTGPSGARALVIWAPAGEAARIAGRWKRVEP
jgi:hypothetical protein